MYFKYFKVHPFQLLPNFQVYFFSIYMFLEYIISYHKVNLTIILELDVSDSKYFYFINFKFSIIKLNQKYYILI